jgi:hypothetical protein
MVKGKNQRANHICGWQIKNREGPLCDSESSIFFFFYSAVAAAVPGKNSLPGRRRERAHKQNRNNNIARAGAVLVLAAGSGACETNASRRTDGSRKRMHSA